jgi:hypothetical protein
VDIRELTEEVRGLRQRSHDFANRLSIVALLDARLNNLEDKVAKMNGSGLMGYRMTELEEAVKLQERWRRESRIALVVASIGAVGGIVAAVIAAKGG